MADHTSINNDNNNTYFDKNLTDKNNSVENP